MAGKYPIQLDLQATPADTDVLVGGTAAGGAGSGRRLVQAAAPTAHSVARRGAGATLKAASGVADDDLVTVLQRTGLNKAITRLLKWYNNDDNDLRLQYDANAYYAADESGEFLDLQTLVRTTDKTGFDKDGKLITFPAGTPALVYDPVTGESLGVSVHEQRTNLLRYSEQFDNAVWTVTTDGTVTIVPNATASPDGELTADLINSDATSALLRNTGQVTSGLTYSLSVFAKAKEYSSLQFTSRDFPNNTLALFNLDAETATAQGSGIGAKIESVGNGWYRCSVQFVATGTGSNRTQIVVPSTVGAGDRGIYLWGAMLETGAFPTPYIKTEATTATRNADVITVPDIDTSDWWNPSEGTFVFDVQLRADHGVTPVNSSIFQIGAQGSTLSTSLSLYASGTAAGRYLLRYGANENVQITGISGSKAKISVKYTTAGAKMSINGSAVSAEIAASVSPTLFAQARLGTSSIGFLNGHIAQILYSRKAVSDARLQELSTL
jgi:hypothetical protein